MKKLLILCTITKIYSGGFGSGGFNSQGFGPGTTTQNQFTSNSQSNQNYPNSWYANQKEIQGYIDLFTQGNQSVHAAYLAMIKSFKALTKAIRTYNFYANTYLNYKVNLPNRNIKMTDLAQAVTTAKNTYLSSEQAFEKALSTMANQDLITAIKNGTFKNIMYIRMLISEYFFARSAIGISPFRSVLQENTNAPKTDYPVWQGFSKTDTQIFESITSYGQAFAQMCNYAQTILISPQQATQNTTNQSSQQNSGVFGQQQVTSSSNNPLTNPLNTFAGVIIQTPQLPKMPSNFFYNTTITASFVTNQQALPITQACNNASASLTPSSFFTFRNDVVLDKPANPTFIGGQITICSSQQTQISAPVTFEITSQVVAQATQLTAIAGAGNGTTATQASINILGNQTLNNQIINFFNNAPNNPWILILEMDFSVDGNNNLTGLTLTPKALAQLNPLIAAPTFTQWQSNIQGSNPVSVPLSYSTTSYNGSYPLAFLPSYFYYLANPRIKDPNYDLPPAYRFTAGITNGYLQSSTAQQWFTIKKAQQNQYGFDGTYGDKEANVVIDNTLFYALKSSYFALKQLYINYPAFAHLDQIITNPTQDIPNIYIGATQNYQPILSLPLTPTPSTSNQNQTSTPNTSQSLNTQSQNSNNQSSTSNAQPTPTAPIQNQSTLNQNNQTTPTTTPAQSSGTSNAQPIQQQ